jgi:hypothetical protein
MPDRCALPWPTEPCKHLENIFARLQVSSRTAAVIKAFPDQVA